MGWQTQPRPTAAERTLAWTVVIAAIAFVVWLCIMGDVRDGGCAACSTGDEVNCRYWRGQARLIHDRPGVINFDHEFWEKTGRHLR